MANDFYKLAKLQQKRLPPTPTPTPATSSTNNYNFLGSGPATGINNGYITSVPDSLSPAPLDSTLIPLASTLLKRGPPDDLDDNRSTISTEQSRTDTTPSTEVLEEDFSGDRHENISRIKDSYSKMRNKWRLSSDTVVEDQMLKMILSNPDTILITLQLYVSCILMILHGPPETFSPSPSLRKSLRKRHGSVCAPTSSKKTRSV